MIATMLLDALHTQGIRLTVEGDQLAVDAPKGTLTDALRQAIREHKTALLTMLSPAPPVHALPPIAFGSLGACTHEEHFPPTLTEGPTRQCRHCPHVWRVPCACAAVKWQFVWQDGLPLWFCLSCGAVYGSDRRVTVTHTAECPLLTNASLRCTCNPVLTLRVAALGRPQAGWC